MEVPTISIRNRLENAIIGGIMHENKINSAWLLKPSHFRSPKNFIIFEAFLKLYPKKPINILTVYNQIVLDGNKDLVSAHELSVLCTKVVSSPNIEYHSFQLVEMDIRDRFIYLLIQIFKQEKNEDYLLILRSIITDIKDPSIDIMAAVEATNNILIKNNFPSWIKSKVLAFKTNIEDTINKLKESNTRHVLFNHLEAICCDSIEDLNFIKQLRRKYVNNSN